LKEAIDRFHKDDTPTRDPGERNLQLRHLLERFVDVCQAIAYAHSRGIVHRDLKPGNIMLCKYGETLVVDWGLAKPIAEKEKTGKDDAEQRRVTLSGSACTSPTLMGAAVGTPQFMSPEQAAGQLDKLGPASDVYSLGATLYSLLTGVVPISDRDLATLLNRVQKGDIAPPRSIKPNIPRPLEAICMKAMALKPEDRYPGAKELADDIERWFGDEPVTAYREPWPARAARWMRKNPAVVAACIVAVPLLVVIALVLNIYKARETRAKLEAIENYQLARDAVDRYDTNVSESVLLNEPGMEPLRERLLDDAGDFYVKFVKKYENDPTVKGELARAKYRLGQITADIKAEKKAIDLLQEAADVFAVDKSVDPAEVARCYHHLGRLYRLTDDFDKSVEWYQKALVVWQSLGGANEEQQAGWARSQFGLGNVLQRQRQFAKAQLEYEQALAKLDKLAQKKPPVPEYQRDKGVVHRNLGMVFAALGEKDAEARAEFGKAIALQQELIKDHPNLSKFQDDLAGSHYTLGDVHYRKNRTKESIAAYQEAVKIWQQLTVTHPAVLDYHARLADGHAALARGLTAARQNEEAIKASERALEVQKRLAAKSAELAGKSETPKYRALLARRFAQHADVLRAAAQPKAAESAYQEAYRIQKQLCDELPNTSDYQADLARTHLGLGRLRLEDKRYNDAETELTKALAIWEKLARNYPESAEFALDVGNACINLRAITSSPGNYRIALAPLDNIVSIYASHAKISQEPALRQAAFQAYWTRAEARTTHALFSEALLDWDRAADLARNKAESAWINVFRAVTLARYGQSAQATEQAEELMKTSDLGKEAYYQFARVFALSAIKEATVKGDGAKEAKQRAEQYAEHATQLLEQARSEGFFANSEVRERISSDPDWQFLRGRKSFEALLRSLQSKTKTP
jgi:tetratricopeptide (TPR) repeat protein